MSSKQLDLTAIVQESEPHLPVITMFVMVVLALDLLVFAGDSHLYNKPTPVRTPAPSP